MKQVAWIISAAAILFFSGSVGPQTKPTEKAAARARQLKAAVKSFQLQLKYNGQSDKPYYEGVVSVTPIDMTKRPAFIRYGHITEDQAKKLIGYLANEGFLDRAVEAKVITAAERRIAKLATPGYTLTVSAGSVSLVEDLGWGLPMLKRLDGLKEVLEGNAAKPVEIILARLAGERKQWEEESKSTKSPW
jgi:hypothetical protein